MITVTHFSPAEGTGHFAQDFLWGDFGKSNWFPTPLIQSTSSQWQCFTHHKTMDEAMRGRHVGGFLRTVLLMTLPNSNRGHKLVRPCTLRLRLTRC